MSMDRSNCRGITDRRRLVKEDLPALAREATRLGAHGVQAGAELMRDELAAASAAASEAWAKGREEHSDLRSWEVPLRRHPL